VVTWLTPGTYNVYVRSATCNGALSLVSQTQTITLPACRDEENQNAEETIEQWSTDNITIFPNPTQGLFYVNVNNTGAERSVSVELMDALGKVLVRSVQIETDGFTQVPVQMPDNAAAGVYLVRTTVNNETHVSRIVYNK
jgi:hypothetical protein